jgi:hypothetical protein
VPVLEPLVERPEKLWTTPLRLGIAWSPVPNYFVRRESGRGIDELTHTAMGTEFRPATRVRW